MKQFEAELLAAKAAARGAGRLIASRWNTEVEVEHKGRIDLVTEVDRAAEAAIVTSIQRAFPTDTIQAEEGSTVAGSSGRRWLIDPLDGTTNFSHGLPHFCVSIALCEANRPVVGVIYEPIRDWMFSTVRGRGAHRNGSALRVSTTSRLDTALVATGFPYDRRTNPHNNLDSFGRVLLAARGGRRAGSAALDLAFVAAGWLDGYWEYRLQPWDVAAGVLLVTESGGKVTGPDGGVFELNSGELAVSNGPLHQELVEHICGSKETA